MAISPALFPAVTVTVVRDRKIRTAQRTNQIAGFVAVPSLKKIISVICSKTRFDGTTHEQSIICWQIFAGHVVGYWPMERKKKLHRMINVLIRYHNSHCWQVV